MVLWFGLVSFQIPPGQIPTKNAKTLVLSMIKGKLNTIDTVYKKRILSFSRPACRRILTWWNLKGLVELANLQSTAMKYYFGV